MTYIFVSGIGKALMESNSTRRVFDARISDLFLTFL